MTLHNALLQDSDAMAHNSLDDPLGVEPPHLAANLFPITVLTKS